MIEIALPFPPSVNEMYGNNTSGRGKGRYEMAVLSKWKAAAGWLLKAQKPKPMTVPCFVAIYLDDCRQGDCANREKAVTDLLVTHKIIQGDQKRWVRGVATFWSSDVTDCVVVLMEESTCTQIPISI